MLAKLLEAVVRGRATFAVKSPPGSLTTPEGGGAAAIGGVGVAARTGGSGGGSGSGAATGSGTAGGAPSAPSSAGASTSASITAPRGGNLASSSSTGKASAARVDRPGGVDSGGGGDNAKRGGPSSAGGEQQQQQQHPQQQEGGVVCTTSRYRSSKSIDGDIMATVVAEARPRGGSGSAGMGGGDTSSPSAGKDGRDVYGPEMGWGLANLGGGGGGGGGEEEGMIDGIAGSSAAAVVVGALKDAKDKGMRLSELRRAAFRAMSAAAAAGAGQGGEDLLAVIGRVVRSSAVVCVCDAEDVRLVAGRLEWGLFSQPGLWVLWWELCPKKRVSAMGLFVIRSLG